MTTREIAATVGREYRAVQNWVSDLSAKNAEISAKIAQAKSTSRPADYTLEETCMIIEEGMGLSAASVYRTNAANAELDKKRGTKTQGKLPAGTQINAMINLYGHAEARKRIDFVLGYKATATPEPLQLPAPRLSKAAYAVEMKEQQKARDKAWQKAHERLLF